jgi:glutathione peroxidase
MKTFVLSLVLALTLTGTSIYDFKVPGLDGNEIDFSKFKGKKILVVNTASQCGYTKQYAGLQELYEKYSDRIVVVGFPANNFRGQEPGSNDEIRAFCQKNYGVTFPMAQKVSVVGDDIHPLFKYLTEEAQKIKAEEPVIKWNFTKFLISEEGKLISVFRSKVEPMSDEILIHLN